MTQGGLVVGSLDICSQRNIILTLDRICLVRKEKNMLFNFKLFIYAIQLLTKIRCWFLLGFL